MTIERLEELKEWFHDVAGRLVSSFHAENCYHIDHLIQAEIDRQKALKERKCVQMKFIVTDIHGVQHEHEADHWKTGRYGLELVNQNGDYETIVVHYAKGKWISVVAEHEEY